MYKHNLCSNITCDLAHIADSCTKWRRLRSKNKDIRSSNLVKNSTVSVWILTTFKNSVLVVLRRSLLRVGKTNLLLLHLFSSVKESCGELLTTLLGLTGPRIELQTCCFGGERSKRLPNQPVDSFQFLNLNRFCFS